MRRYDWIAGFVILSAVYMSVAGQTVADGSVAYWVPKFVDGVRSAATTPQVFVGARTTLAYASSQSFQPRCFGGVGTIHGDEEVYTELVPSEHGIWSSVVGKMKNDLLGREHTFALQTSFSGAYKECPFGCFYELEYLYKKYNNVCINSICKIGQVKGTSEFCEPDNPEGDNVYYKQRTWWCGEITRKWIDCGTGHCYKQQDGEYSCKFSDETSKSNGVEYSIVSPANPNSPFMVAAYQNERLLAKKPISNMSAEAYVARYGSVDASQAESLAVGTGLAELVESIVGNPFAVSRLRQFR